MCNLTTEEFNVSITHPFQDTITYNVTPEIPSGWTISPTSQNITISSIGTQTVTFDITSSNTDETEIINATINYTYPTILRTISTSYTINTSTSNPILEIIRETPREVSNDKLIHSFK